MNHKMILQILTVILLFIWLFILGFALSHRIPFNLNYDSTIENKLIEVNQNNAFQCGRLKEIRTLTGFKQTGLPWCDEMADKFLKEDSK